MRTPRIYTPQILQLSEPITLEEQASHHLIRVLRLQEQHPVIVFNGQGGFFQGKISIAHKKHTQVTLTHFQTNNANSCFLSHIAIGLSKADKLELIIQKATELGVESISPITTDHSDVKMNSERAEKKYRQWQQIAIGACEQSARNLLPIIQPIQSYADWLSNTLNRGDEIGLFHTEGGSRLSSLQKPAALHLCFGPEGGFSNDEVALARNNSCHILTLGERILRAETAPIATLGAVQTLWGDW